MTTDKEHLYNAKLYATAEQLHSGVDADYIDDLCLEISGDFQIEIDKVKLAVQHFYKEHFEK